MTRTGKWQARSYAALVGLSESTLQYVIGGISALSGGRKPLGDKVLSKVLGQVAKVDNALARTALNFGARLAVSGFGEGLEEGLQEVLEPAFATMITGQDYEVDAGDVAYAFFMGYLVSNVFEAPGAYRAATAPTALATVRFSSAGMDSYLGANGVDYFAGCQSAEDVRARYRELARKNHPDVGGSEAVMAEINRQRTIQDAFYTGTQKAAETAQRAAGPESAQRAQETATASQTESFQDVVRKQAEGQNTTAQQSGAVVRADTSLFDRGILKNFNEARKNFIAYAKKHFPAMVVNRNTGRTIGISRNGLDKFLSGNLYYEKYASGFHIPELVQNAVKVAEAGNYHTEAAQSIPSYEYYDSSLTIDGEDYTAHIRVRNTLTGDKYYGHTISQVENIEIEPSTRASSPGSQAVQPVNIDGSTERPTDTVYNTGNETGPAPYVQNVPPSGFPTDSVPRAEQDVNGGPVELSLPTVDEDESLAEWIVNTALEGLSLPTLEDVEPVGLSLPTLDEAEPLAEWIVNKALEGLSLPTLDDIEPVGLSLPMLNGAELQLGQIAENGPETLSGTESKSGQSAGGDSSKKPGEVRQIGVVDFKDKRTVFAQLRQAKADFASLDHEMNCTVTADGKVWRITGIAGLVNSWGIEAQGSSLKGSYSYHNHPAAKTNYSFSADDVAFFFASGEECSYASDNLYEYIMLRTTETLDVDPDVVYHEFDTLLYTEAYPLAWSEVINPDTDNYHVIMTELSKKYGFLYERRQLNGT